MQCSTVRVTAAGGGGAAEGAEEAVAADKVSLSHSSYIQCAYIFNALRDAQWLLKEALRDAPKKKKKTRCVEVLPCSKSHRARTLLIHIVNY